MTRTHLRGVAAGLSLALMLIAAPRLAAQVAQGAPPPPAVQQPARVAAPIDFSGTWASVVTEDWQWRFVTPIVGDYTGVPLNADGDKAARAWDHAADLKAGEQCKAFGAAGINRLPTRMQISWVDDNTMKLEWDLGTQSRLVYFDKSMRPSGPLDHLADARFHGGKGRAAGGRGAHGRECTGWHDGPASAEWACAPQGARHHRRSCTGHAESCTV